MAERHDFGQIIAEIEASGLSLYKIGLLMHRTVTQMKRIKVTGRCQHYEGEMLLEIHRSCVPRVEIQVIPTMLFCALT